MLSPPGSADLIRRGRPWADSAVWGALWMLSTGDAPRWLAAHQPSRIRRRLHELSTSGVLWASRTRAEVYRFRASHNVVETLTPHVVVSGARAVVVVATDCRLDGYVTPERFQWLARDFPIVPGGNAANVVLRVSELAALVENAHMPSAFAAVDMEDSTNESEREQGVLLLDDLLRGFTGRRRDWLTAPEIADAVSGETDEVFVLRLMARGLSDARSLIEPVDVIRFMRKPPPTGDRHWDVLLAALVARECRLRGMEPPKWTDVPGLEPWWFPALVDETMIPLAVQRTPPELARKGIWLDERALVTV